MKRNVWMAVVALLLVSVCLMGVTGCLTVGEKSELQDLMGQSELLAESALAGKEAVAKAFEDFQAGKLSWEDFKVLADHYDAVRDQAASVAAQIEEMKAREVPVWATILMGIVGLGSGGLFGVKAMAVAKTLKGVLGVFGAVSRAGDKVENFGDLVNEEIPNSPGITAEDVTALHHRATAREI